MTNDFFRPRGLGEKPTGRWIAEEIGPGETGDDDYLVYMPCKTEAIARAIEAKAKSEGWRVEVYPERTVTGFLDGNFPTTTNAQVGFKSLSQYDRKYG
jgi:hypothetical protein